jgi:hypothetical protein
MRGFAESQRQQSVLLKEKLLIRLAYARHILPAFAGRREKTQAAFFTISASFSNTRFSAGRSMSRLL